MSDMEYKYDVFISYSRKDTEVANRICNAFDNAGITYFIDRQGIGGGMEFPAALAKAIRESKVFLYLASKNSYDSKFTQSEIVYAFNKKQKKVFLPYIIDGSSLPDELEFTFSAINWRQMDRHPIETVLIGDVLTKIGKQPPEGYISLAGFENQGEKKNIGGLLSRVNSYLTGQTLAIAALAIAGMLFVTMLLLTKAYIQEHKSIIENILMIYLLLLVGAVFIGMIRPASLCLANREQVLKFYVSAVFIDFFAIMVMA